MRKQCNGCGEVKSIDEFTRDSTKKDGHRAQCKVCWNKRKRIYNKTYRQRSKQKYIVKKAESIGATVEMYCISKEIAERVNKEQKQIRELNQKKEKLFRKQIEFENSVMVKEFKCTQCGETKSITEFYHTRQNKRGYESRCKVCENTRERPWEETDEYKKRKKEYDKKYRQREDRREKRIAAWLSGRYKRRALMKDSGHITAKELRELDDKWNGKCYWCGCKVKNKHYDHYIPISKGGLNTIDNIVISCAFCNISKHDKMPEEFAMKRGRLL